MHIQMNNKRVHKIAISQCVANVDIKQKVFKDSLSIVHISFYVTGPEWNISLKIWNFKNVCLVGYGQCTSIQVHVWTISIWCICIKHGLCMLQDKVLTNFKSIKYIMIYNYTLLLKVLGKCTKLPHVHIYGSLSLECVVHSYKVCCSLHMFLTCTCFFKCMQMLNI